MQLTPLHPWPRTAAEAIALQRQLAQRLLLDGTPPQLRRVAGVDVSSAWRGNLLHAAVVVLSFPELEPLETVTASLTTDFPYIPGLLSFRELPVILAALAKLAELPDLLLVDGQGVAHPRRFGLACHLGLWLERPTIGCAKSRLCGAAELPGPARGEQTPLWGERPDEQIGVVLRSKERCKPLYVSPGHRLGIAGSAELVLACGKGYRLPEPTRLAHLASSSARRRQMAASA